MLNDFSSTLLVYRVHETCLNVINVDDLFMQLWQVIIRSIMIVCQFSPRIYTNECKQLLQVTYNISVSTQSYYYY